MDAVYCLQLDPLAAIEPSFFKVRTSLSYNFLFLFHQTFYFCSSKHSYTCKLEVENPIN
ncbi:hypothetical protein Hanom_Chr06g00563791 [Helianthus anomalus]